MTETRCKTCDSLYPDAPLWIDFGLPTQHVCPDRFHKKFNFFKWNSEQFFKKHSGEKRHTFQWIGPENDAPGASVPEGAELLAESINHYIDLLTESIRVMNKKKLTPYTPSRLPKMTSYSDVFGW